MPRWRIIKYYAWQWFMILVASRTPSAVRFQQRMQDRVLLNSFVGWSPVYVSIGCIYVLPAPWNHWVGWSIIAGIIAHGIKTLPHIIKIRRRVRSLDGRCCTVCGYDLRGVPQHDLATESGRCPECGYRFSIAETRKLFGLES